MPARLKVILTVFLVTGIVVVGSAIVTFWAGNRVLHAHAREEKRGEAVARLDQLEAVLKEAETGQRGFVITGDEAYLQPFNRATAEWQAEVNALRDFHWIDVQPEEINRLIQLGEEKMTELRRTIELRRQGGFEAALSAIRAGAGKQYMDDLHTQIGLLKNRETRELQLDAELSDQTTRYRTLIFLSCGALNLVVLFWAYRRTAEGLKQRDIALEVASRRRQDLQDQKDLLSVTLGSIGDCVMVTNEEGRITFMNPVAEQVTGWKFNEARGRLTSEVFRILNEDTRKPVENPVEKVIRQGVIVGLANHTLLIRKDGSEIAIDDSGAPIRDQHGGIRGVVLVFRDFSEQKEAERELRLAKEAAESANKTKDQFLAMLSHELRTPLTPVLATLNLWEASEEVPGAMLADIQMLRQSIELEARIIDDLLDLTRIARGLLTIAPENTDVHNLIEFLVGLSQNEFRSKELTLTLRLDAERYHVHTDAARLQQVLWNILRNAIKFTEEGGSVTVATSNDSSNQIEIAVIDSGIGMSPETRSKLFVPFEQADRARSNRYGGLGLGLAISKALTDLLKGELTGESPGPGHGSTFRIKFPTLDPARIADETTTAPVPSPDELRLLLIEDHMDTARTLSRLLEKRGFGVKVASSIASGLETLQQEQFDLLLCDLGLPDGSGIDFIQKVRARHQTPAIALTGYGMQEDVERARNAGFDVHLTKPVNLQRLEATIWQLLQKERVG